MKGDGQQLPPPTQGLRNHSSRADAGCATLSELLFVSEPVSSLQENLDSHLHYAHVSIFSMCWVPHQASETELGPRQVMLCLPRLRCQCGDGSTSDQGCSHSSG